MTSLDLAILVMRVALGITFIVHGGQKCFGWMGGSGVKGMTGMLQMLGCARPGVLAWMATVSEIGGGVLVLFGLLTQLGAALIVSAMIVAVATVHAKNGFLSSNRGYEYNLNLSALGIALMLTGGGLWSLDHLLGIAMPLGQLPVWAIVILVIVPFGGIVSTELAVRLNGARNEPQQTAGAGQK